MQSNRLKSLEKSQKLPVRIGVRLFGDNEHDSALSVLDSGL